MDGEIQETLDSILGVLNLAFRDAIEKAKAEVRADSVNAALLDATEEGWVSAGELRKKVANLTGKSERTVARGVASLLALRAIKQRGAGSKVEYLSTGLL